MRRAAPVLLAFALLAAGCGRPATEGTYRLRVGVPSPFAWDGPRTSSGGAAVATDLVYESLLYPSGDRLASAFLRRWERVEGGRWRLELASGRRFSDGSPVTAEDLARSLRDNGFRVEREEDALLVDSLSGTGDLAGLMLVPVTRGEGIDALGTGPFAVAERSEHRLLLRRVVPAPGRIAAVEMLAFASTREAFAQLLRGELNAVLPLERPQVELLDGVPGLRVVSGLAPNAIVAFLNPRRLSQQERRALADSVPVAEVAARAGLGARCPSAPPRRAIPAGGPLRIGHVAFGEESTRAALALRRALGRRGGELVLVAPDKGAAGAGLDILVRPALVWPSVMLATTLEAGARYNPFSYSIPAFEAAVRRGDEAGAAAALLEDPPAIVLCRRERLMAIDARVRDPSLSPWGVLDSLAEWRVGP